MSDPRPGQYVRHVITGDRYLVEEDAKGTKRFVRDTPLHKWSVGWSRKTEFVVDEQATKMVDAHKAQVAYQAVRTLRGFTPRRELPPEWASLDKEERAEWIRKKPPLKGTEKRLHDAVIIALEKL